MVKPCLHEKNANCPSSEVVTSPRLGACKRGQGSKHIM